MPRYSRTRFRGRYTRRRYVRRTLSTRNIYANRSAYAQATQIAALRRRINKVYRAAKPERKVVISTPSQFSLNSSAAGYNNLSQSALDIANGSTDEQRIGDKVYRKDTFYLTFEYFNNSDTGYHDSESSGTSIRIICGAWKDVEGATTVPSATAVVHNYSSTGAYSTIAAVAPLVTGITEKQEIYRDFTFNMTSSSNQKTIKVSTPWYSS